MTNSNIKIAGLIKRFLALIIDLVVSIFLIYVISAIFLKPYGGLFGAMGLNDFQFGEDLVKGAFAGVSAFFVLFLVFVGALFIIFLYDFLMVASPMQATLGKHFMNIKVMNSDGSSIGIFKALVRSFLKFLSGFLCFLPWFFAIFTERKQSLHDLLVSAVVVEEIS